MERIQEQRSNTNRKREERVRKLKISYLKADERSYGAEDFMEHHEQDPALAKVSGGEMV